MIEIKSKKGPEITREELDKEKQDMKNFENEYYKIKNQYKNKFNDYMQTMAGYCKNNIGRCFKMKKSDNDFVYFKVMDIDKLLMSLDSFLSFNEYQYPVIKFNYPYDNSELPFLKNKLYINNAKNKIGDFIDENEYIEIDIKEYNEKFEEVDEAWKNKIFNI